MELVHRDRFEHLVGDVGHDFRLAISDHAGHPRVGSRVRRIALRQLGCKRDLGRVRMRESERMDAAVLLEQVDRTPIGDLRNGEARDGLQRSPVVEGFGEHGSRTKEELLGLLRPLLRVDVRRRSDPEVDRASVVVPERHRTSEVPAVAAVGRAEAIFDLEDLSGRESLAAYVERPLQIVGMDDADPLVAGRRPRRQARVLVPAAVVVGGLAVRPCGPHDLRHRVGERTVSLFALSPRRRELALARELRLPSELQVLTVQIDEHRDLRPQHIRIEGLEQVVDRACRVAAKDVFLLLRDRRQEDDRNRARLCALLDQCCSFEPVETRHLRIEQDHGDLLYEEAAKGLLAGVGEDEVLS